jgi:cytochrome c oxidase subunit 1
MGFLYSFTFGGFTGLILANCIIDTVLHDSYFIVGHFHYVLSLGAVYSIFASIYTYYLLFTSLLFYEWIGRFHWLLFFYSSNLLFMPFHSLGILSFPRRIFDFNIIYFRFH